MRTPFVLLVAALLVLAGAPVADARRQVPHGFYGVMWDRAALRADATEQQEQWDLMARSGVESVRAVFSWARAQPADGRVPDFTETDRLVGLAAARRIRLVPVVYKTPPWAARDSYPGSPPAEVGTYTPTFRRSCSATVPAGASGRSTQTSRTGRCANGRSGTSRTSTPTGTSPATTGPPGPPTTWPS